MKQTIFPFHCPFRFLLTMLCSFQFIGASHALLGLLLGILLRLQKELFFFSFLFLKFHCYSLKILWMACSPMKRSRAQPPALEEGLWLPSVGAVKPQHGSTLCTARRSSVPGRAAERWPCHSVSRCCKTWRRYWAPTTLMWPPC